MTLSDPPASPPFNSVCTAEWKFDANQPLAAADAVGSVVAGARWVFHWASSRCQARTLPRAYVILRASFTCVLKTNFIPIFNHFNHGPRVERLCAIHLTSCVSGAAAGGKMSALIGELPREVGNVEGRVQECVTVNMWVQMEPHTCNDVIILRF